MPNAAEAGAAALFAGAALFAAPVAPAELAPFAETALFAVPAAPAELAPLAEAVPFAISAPFAVPTRNDADSEYAPRTDGTPAPIVLCKPICSLSGNGARVIFALARVSPSFISERVSPF